MGILDFMKDFILALLTSVALAGAGASHGHGPTKKVDRQHEIEEMVKWDKVCQKDVIKKLKSLSDVKQITYKVQMVAAVTLLESSMSEIQTSTAWRNYVSKNACAKMSTNGKKDCRRLLGKTARGTKYAFISLNAMNKIGKAYEFFPKTEACGEALFARV